MAGPRLRTYLGKGFCVQFWYERGAARWLPERLIRQPNKTVSRATVSLEISPLASSTDSNKENEEAALPSESNPVSAHDKERRQNPLLKPSQAESPAQHSIEHGWSQTLKLGPHWFWHKKTGPSTPWFPSHSFNLSVLAKNSWTASDTYCTPGNSYPFVPLKYYIFVREEKEHPNVEAQRRHTFVPPGVIKPLLPSQGGKPVSQRIWL